MSDPIKLLKGYLNIDFPVDFVSDFSSPFNGVAFRWHATMYVYTQPIGIPRDNFSYQYDVTDVVVGDWVSNSDTGRALKIVEIIDRNDTTVTFTLEDVGFYNVQMDTSGTQDGSLQSGPCFLFTVTEENLPVLGPLELNWLSDIIQDNLLARFVRDYETSGGSEFLGTPTDGTFDDGAIRGWQTGVTTFTDAIDQLNLIMNKALPEKPTNVSDLVITYTNESPVVEGTLLADGANVINYGLSTDYPYLTEITAISGTTPVSHVLSDVGLGDYGVLTLKLNDTIIGTRMLTGDDDTGTYGGLQILSDHNFPPGLTVWSAMDIVVGMTVPAGISMSELSHTTTGTKRKTFIVEDMLAIPTITNPAVSVDVPVLTYSSGVPHLSLGSTLKYSITGDKLVGRTFAKENMMGLTTNPVLGTSELSYTHAQFPTPLIINNGPISVADEVITLEAENTAATASFVFNARNSFQEFTMGISTLINYMSGDGSLGAYLAENTDELTRVTLDDGDRPAVGAISFDTPWDSGSSSSLGDLKAWEAPIIGGVALASQINYSTGYMPVGPDFSAKPAIQYITFKFQSITNRITLNVLGTYSGMWIKLPGIANSMPNAVNGWWDATKQADFAPTLYPGHEYANDGCLLDTSANGGTSYTFGSISSAGSTDNMILVRFALTTSDSISAIQIL